MSWIEHMGYDIAPWERTDKYWTTKDGVRIKPEDMSESHRENTVAMMIRKYGESYALGIPVIAKMYRLNLEVENK